MPRTDYSVQDPLRALCGLIRPAMHVEFFGLGLVLRASGKVLLRGVTGQVRHARLTAIMGPSGSGARFGYRSNSPPLITAPSWDQVVMHWLCGCRASWVGIRQIYVLVPCNSVSGFVAEIFPCGRGAGVAARHSHKSVHACYI